MRPNARSAVSRVIDAVGAAPVPKGCNRFLFYRAVSWRPRDERKERSKRAGANALADRCSRPSGGQGRLAHLQAIRAAFTIRRRCDRNSDHRVMGLTTCAMGSSAADPDVIHCPECRNAKMRPCCRCASTGLLDRAAENTSPLSAETLLS